MPRDSKPHCPVTARISRVEETLILFSEGFSVGRLWKGSFIMASCSTPANKSNTAMSTMTPMVAAVREQGTHCRKGKPLHITRSSRETPAPGEIWESHSSIPRAREIGSDQPDSTLRFCDFGDRRGH